ncbi:MAG: CvpA family protein [Muribaculaceae bacterium]|nr:CvpA family protein [Muribaculaceae bacterium]
MTFVDALILLIALGALVVGWRKGLIKQLASLVSWVIGIVVCLFLGDEVTRLFLAINPEAAQWPLAGITVKAVALSMLFLVVTLTLRVEAYVTRKVVKMARLGCLDRVGGAALFAFKYLFALSIVLNLYYAYNPDAETFGTRHMLNNKPYEITLDLMPRVLGADVMPSDSLKLYRDAAQPCDSIDITTQQPSNGV